MEIYVVSKAENGLRSSLFAWPAFGHVTSFRKTKTSDFFDTNLRTFEAKPPYFCLKKSDVFLLPKHNTLLLRKKCFCKKPTFPTSISQISSFYWHFRV